MPTLYAAQRAAYCPLVVVHDGLMDEAVGLIAPAEPSVVPIKARTKGEATVEVTPLVPKEQATSSLAVAVVRDGPVGLIVAVPVLTAKVSNAPALAVSRIATLTGLVSEVEITT